METPQPYRTIRTDKFRRIARVISRAWILGVIVLSFIPGSEKLRLGTDPYVPHHAVGWQHRWGHFFAFGITAVLLLLGSVWRGAEKRAATAAILLGVMIETIQYLTGLAATFEWWDVRDDSVGVLVGVVLTSFLVRYLGTRASEKA